MKNDRRNGNDGKYESNKGPSSDACHASHSSHSSHSSHPPLPEERLLPPRCDYRTLLSFQKAEVIYDLTFRFAHKYLEKGDRTAGQMIQAALTSKETEIKLTNVARAGVPLVRRDARHAAFHSAKHALSASARVGDGPGNKSGRQPCSKGCRPGSV